MENYDKLREIGKGSYGVVWLVKNRKDRKNYVLKRIDLRKSSERDKQSAQQEAQLLKNLKHPNIVAYKESFQIDGYLHIVMLYCDGGDLYTKIKEQNGKYLEESQVVEWFVQIAMALQYMHERYILHRDLKTQNIFLTKNKIIKVGDLGIARVLKSNNDMATTIIGTPYYMSPELFTNKPYNSKSDVWALGCCVYEMTTLKHAFNAKDMTSLVFKITKGKMPEIPEYYSKELITLIKSMLNADPKLRPTANKILRDPFIKKNIMLFLERTKQRQQQQLERERQDPEVRQKFSIQDKLNLNRNPKNDAEYQSEPVKSEFVNFNNLKQVQQKQEPVLEAPKIKPRSSNPFMNDKLELEDDSKPRKLANKNRVRISTVVENIETKEHFDLIDSSQLSDKQDLSEEEINEPYQLTKPIKNINLNEPKLRNNKSDSVLEIHSPQQPKIMERKPIIVSNQAKIHQADNPSQFKAENESLDHDPQQPMQPNLSARERRRLKLRLSQNETNNPDSKPPLLKKLAIKSNQSEVFYNSQNKSSPSINSPSNPVSKSLNDHENKQNLKDSLKIFRKNSNPSPNEPKNPSDLIQQQNKLERNPYFAKNKPLSNNTPQSSSSSSSSSIASSNEENDPGKELVRIEKKKKKDKKEMDNFIDELSCTLKKANKNDSELEDIKDEILDDLEEEALQCEMNDSSSSNNELKRNEYNIKPRNVEIYNNRDIKSNDKYEIIKHRNISNNRLEQNDKPNFGATLGATNHMYSRINSLEKECLALMGKEKLNEVFKTLDSFKDDEVEVRLINLIGNQNYKEYSGKLWLLKFLKDTAKIGMR